MGIAPPPLSYPKAIAFPPNSGVYPRLFLNVLRFWTLANSLILLTKDKIFAKLFQFHECHDYEFFLCNV